MYIHCMIIITIYNICTFIYSSDVALLPDTLVMGTVSGTSITFSWPAPENVNFLMNYRVAYSSTPISTSKRRRRQSLSSDILTVPADMRSTDLVFQPYSRYIVRVDAIYNPPNSGEVTVRLLPTTPITTPQGSKKLQIHSHNTCSTFTFTFTCTIHVHACSCKCTCDSNYNVHAHTHACTCIYTYNHTIISIPIHYHSLLLLYQPQHLIHQHSVSNLLDKRVSLGLYYPGPLLLILMVSLQATRQGIHMHMQELSYYIHLYMYILHFLSRCLSIEVVVLSYTQ